MSLSYSLQSDTIIYKVDGDGEVDYNEGFLTLQEAIKKAKEANPKIKWNILFDISASKENRSSDELENIAKYIGMNRDILSGKSAVIVSDNFHFGVSRIFATFLTEYGVDMQIFKKESNAERWLREQYN